jgi:hypothetical protein
MQCPKYKKQQIKELHEVFESEITYVNAMETRRRKKNRRMC